MTPLRGPVARARCHSGLVPSIGQRPVGITDVVGLGLAAMVGCGAFFVWAPAAGVAGPWLPFAVLLAAVAACCTAASISDLAVAHPRGRRTLGYARELLWSGTERLAGVAFLVAKITAGAAAAQVIGMYVLPAGSTLLAVIVIAVTATLNVVGLRWATRGAYIRVAGTVVVLLTASVAGFLSPGMSEPDALPVDELDPLEPIMAGPLCVLTAAGLVLFAFNGYGVIADRVSAFADQRRTLRVAVLLVIGAATVIYLVVVAALLVALGVDWLAREPTPLAAVVDADRSWVLGVIVRTGAAFAVGSTLLTILAGAAEAVRELARAGELPGHLAHTSQPGRAWRADLVAAAATLLVALTTGPVTAIVISVGATLAYSVVVHIAALRLPPSQRSWPIAMSLLGLLMCVTLAAFLPAGYALVTVVVLAVGWALCATVAHTTPHRSDLHDESR